MQPFKKSWDISGGAKSQAMENWTLCSFPDMSLVMSGAPLHEVLHSVHHSSTGHASSSSFLLVAFFKVHLSKIHFS